MTYREFLNSLSDEDFSEVIAQDGIFTIACVDNFKFEDDQCPHGYANCKECILKLMQSEVTEDTYMQD